MPKVKEPIQNELPEIAHIRQFLTAGVSRSANDELNKIRENIIANMTNYNETYFNDVEHGVHWRNIHDKFMEKIPLLCTEPYARFTITHKGGMSKNYDFLLSFLDEDDKEIKQVKLEFKHNNSDVTDLPQFLELSDKDCKDKYELCTMGYDAFYYANYFDKYLACDDEITEPKPEQDIYLKHLYDFTYKHPFFSHLRDKTKNKREEKLKIARESYADYLYIYSHSFKFGKLTEKLRESQKDKFYLLWDCVNFHIQKIDNVDILNIVGIKENTNEIKKNNKKGACLDLVVDNFQYDISMRLNWGNNGGLCNPRWKLTYINK